MRLANRFGPHADRGSRIEEANTREGTKEKKKSKSGTTLTRTSTWMKERYKLLALTWISKARTIATCCLWSRIRKGEAKMLVSSTHPPTIATVADSPRMTHDLTIVNSAAIADNRDRHRPWGGGPGWWGSFWLAGEPGTLGLAGDHGPEGGVVVGEWCAMALVRMLLRRHLVPGVEVVRGGQGETFAWDLLGPRLRRPRTPSPS